MKPAPQNATERYGAKLAGHLHHPADEKPDPPHVVFQEKTKRVGKAKRYRAGSTDSRVDMVIGTGAIAAGPCGEDRDTRTRMAKAVMEAVKPRNELEGMLAAQMMAAHSAAMEAYGRAARSEIVPTIDTYLSQASKASRTYVTLLEALDRHRGKGGQQKVRVEHVHVYEGGQAIVGAIEGPGGARGGKRIQRQAHAHTAAVAHTSQPALRSSDPVRQPLPVPRDGEREVSDARGREHGCEG